MSENIINYIENKATCKAGRKKEHGESYDWQIIVRETLLQVYGSNISQYSALGSRRGEHPAINHALYLGLYGIYFFTN